MKLKRLVAGLTALAMTASMFTFTAFAADEDESGSTAITEISFTSTLKLTDDAVTAPNVTYTYALATIEEDTTVKVDATNDTTEKVYAGALPTDGVEKTASFSPADLAASNKVCQTVTLDVGDLTFENGGFYLYTLSQTEIDPASDDNFTSDDSVLYVYLEVSLVDNAFVITDYLVMDGALTSLEDNTAKSEGFVNYYGYSDTSKDEKIDENDDDTGLDFIVEAYSFGSMANSIQTFDYTVTVEGADEGMVYAVSGYSGISYVKVVKVEDATNGDYYALYTATADADGKGYTAGDVAEFSLAENGTFTILSVVSGLEFTVTVEDDLNLGYSVESRKYTEAGGTDWDEASAVTLDESGVAYEYTMVVYDSLEDDTDGYVQGRDVATFKGDDLTPDDDDTTEDDAKIDYSGLSLPDTGVILEFAPFALMVLAAGAFISLRAISAAKQRK